MTPYTVPDNLRPLFERAYAWLAAGGDAINGEKLKFDMRDWNCGSRACIGGFLEATGCPLNVSTLRESHPLNTLFCPATNGNEDYDIGCGTIGRDAAWGARCVRKLLDEGVIDWTGTR